MHWTTPLKQHWLLSYENPLTARLGRDFFLGLPKSPGIYRFFGQYAGEENALLYVGKAKDLRARLNSYRQAKPDAVSRKVLWMIWQVERIEFETCSSERQALLRENELLRALRPPYNVLNTEPENYLYITTASTDRGLKLRVTRDGDIEEEKERFFGVFRSRKAVRNAYGSLLRLLWMCAKNDDEDGRYEVPSALLRYRPPSPYYLKSDVDPHWEKLLNQYLGGRSRALLREMTSRLLEKSAIPPFMYHRVQEDLEELSEFFKTACSKNRKLCRHFGRKGALIAQHEIDDWLVAFKFR